MAERRWTVFPRVVPAVRRHVPEGQVICEGILPVGQAGAAAR